jgi:hypothetical protein
MVEEEKEEKTRRRERGEEGHFMQHLHRIYYIHKYTSNCWGSGLYPSSGILRTRNQKDSETGLVFFLR